MKRFAQTVLLKDDPDIIEKYEEYHANPWPEVCEGTLRCGVERAFIFRFGRQLFMFIETPDDFDMKRDMPKYMEDPRAKEWDELMRSYQEPVPGAPAGSTWVPMEEVFALEKNGQNALPEDFFAKPDVSIRRSGLTYTDKVVVITGGTKGIGEGCARVFVDAGATVVAIGRDAETGNTLANDLNEKGPGSYQLELVDVTESKALKQVLDKTVDRTGRLDCLINNAGYHPPHKTIDEFALDEFQHVLQTNLVAYFMGCKYALPHLRKTKGSIINLSSLVGDMGQELATTYCATKGAITSMTKSLAIEEARHEVRVNCIQPGNIYSNSMLQWLQTPAGKQQYHWITKNQHLGRVGTNEEVGQLCLFLASEAASYLTGLAINVSAGAELGYGTKFPLHFANE